MMLGELQMPSSLEDVLGAFPLLKPISPDFAAVKRWVELESADTMACGSDDSTRPDGSESETSVIDDLTPLVADPSLNAQSLSASLATLWPAESTDIDDLPLAENFVAFEPMKPSKAATKMPWTRVEDMLITEGVGLYGNKWSKIAGTLPEPRTDDAVRNRWHRLMNKQSRRPPPASDAGDETPPSSKRQCSPSLPRPPLAGCDAPPAASTGSVLLPKEPGKHGDMWTADEDKTIDNALRVRGLRWKAIAALLPGRTESGCRNRWVRNQERVFAAAGLQVHGAQAVFTALESARQGPPVPSS